MFCTRCGARNSDEAVYCQKCGNLLETEEETRIAPKIRSNGDTAEQEIFSIGPTLLFVKLGYVLTAVGAVLLVAFFSVSVPAVPTAAAVLFGLALFLIPAFYHFRRRMVRYTLTDSKIAIDEGFVFQHSRNIPLRSVQDVTVSASIAQRMLGFGDLIIDNATEDVGKIVLQNINSPKKYADLLLRQMRLLDK